jgi:hypothetical protein
VTTCSHASALQYVSQDKAAQAAAATRSEQQIHLLERARKSELVADLALPPLPVSTYQEQPLQRRGPAPQEPREIDPKVFGAAVNSKLTGNDTVQIRTGLPLVER